MKEVLSKEETDGLYSALPTHVKALMDRKFNPSPVILQDLIEEQLVEHEPITLTLTKYDEVVAVVGGRLEQPVYAHLNAGL